MRKNTLKGAHNGQLTGSDFITSAILSDIGHHVDEKDQNFHAVLILTLKDKAELFRQSRLCRSTSYEVGNLKKKEKFYREQTEITIGLHAHKIEYDLQLHKYS